MSNHYRNLNLIFKKSKHFPKWNTKIQCHSGCMFIHKLKSSSKWHYWDDQHNLTSRYLIKLYGIAAKTPDRYLENILVLVFPFLKKCVTLCVTLFDDQAL